MLCYKDSTFCNFYLECKKGNKCSRALTDKVKEDAERWWDNEDYPICVYLDKPDCFKAITDNG